jgi:hypothetical protein
MAAACRKAGDFQAAPTKYRFNSNFSSQSTFSSQTAPSGIRMAGGVREFCKRLRGLAKVKPEARLIS